jgi:phage-related protein
MSENSEIESERNLVYSDIQNLLSEFSDTLSNSSGILELEYGFTKT